MTKEREQAIRDLIEQARALFNVHDVRGLAPELDLANGAAELFDELIKAIAALERLRDGNYGVLPAEIARQTLKEIRNVKAE